MGFCRRCGDIVVGPRCKCGGTSVAPAVQWNQIVHDKNTDRWSQTYVSRERSPSRSPSRGPTTAATSKGQLERSVSPTKHFPRPASTTSNAPHNVALASRVTSHITSTTSSRPPSPLKYSSVLPSEESNPPRSPTSAAAAAGIIPSPYKDSELSKVYGSVLQPKESLATYSCAVCTTPFPPDATIYPDPASASQDAPTRFLCRSCFTTHGGTRGSCPTCARAVLILKSEGGFVENAGRVWHKGCFRCEACFKNIGDSPMVDLMGRPCCADCFDGCLNRASASSKGTPVKTPKREESAPESRLGGMRRDGKSREGSPAIEELEQRLRIVKSREASPALEDLSQRLSGTQGRDSPIVPRHTSNEGREGSPLAGRRGRGRSIVGIGGSPGESPISTLRGYAKFESPKDPKSPGRGSPAGSPKVPTEEAIEEMKRRFLKGASASPAPSPSTTPSRQSQTRDSPIIKSPTPESRIPLSTRGSGSPVLRSSGTSSISNLRARRDNARVGDSSDEPETSGIFSPPSSDIASPTSSLSSLSLLRGHGFESIQKNGRSSGASEISMPSTPDLMSDLSSSGSASPSPPSKKYDVFGDYLDTSRENEKVYIKPVRDTPKRDVAVSGDYVNKVKADHDATTPTRKLKPCISIPHDACAKCGLSLVTHNGGQFVTVPDEPRSVSSAAMAPKTYHTQCFRCAECGDAFREEEGRAVFVRDKGRAVHVECAPPEKVNVRSFPSAIPIASTASKPSPTSAFSPSSSVTYTSNRYERPPLTAPASATTFPRFGSTAVCPGCTKNVSPMERGVVPGPGGTRWHTGCLVCGGGIGAGARRRLGIGSRGVGGWGQEEKTKPGCGKKLDSSAKGDGDGGIWCRACLLLIPAALRNSPHGSPTRGPLVPSYTGTNIQPQFTGTTTLARQFTGVGGNGVDGELMRQLTGGGLSPTRQLLGSPTKQPAGAGVRRPRPKSVIGMRGKSIDEGRGMFLVRQMTGGAVGD